MSMYIAASLIHLTACGGYLRAITRDLKVAVAQHEQDEPEASYEHVVGLAVVGDDEDGKLGRALRLGLGLTVRYSAGWDWG